MDNVSKRPGRKIAAEQRRIAKEIMQEFIDSGEFYILPYNVRCAIFTTTPSLKEQRIYQFVKREVKENAIV